MLPDVKTKLRKCLERAEKAGWTRYGIAKKSGVKQAVVQRFITDGKGLSLENAEKLLAFFGLDVYERGSGTGQIPDPPANSRALKKSAKKKATKKRAKKKK